MGQQASLFSRFLLPGFAFKAVVIGGGYATGRELAEFFLPHGPLGGLLGMVVAMLVWSVTCAIAFSFARLTQSFDFRSFFKQLLGPGAIIFEIAYYPMTILALSVFGAAAGELGLAAFGMPPIVGTCALMLGIAAVTAFGTAAVERLFKYVSFFLYGIYALFLAFVLASFGDRIPAALATPVHGGWISSGITYASYNAVAAVVILPVLRHLQSRRDALIAGILAGPLAMAPAILFFACMGAFYPAIGSESLPSDYLLRQLNQPVFQLFFEIMIFSALLESGTGSVHAVNERIAEARGGPEKLSHLARLGVSSAILITAIVIADRFGLITLISNGYRALAVTMLVLFVVPLLTIGLYRLARGGEVQQDGAGEPAGNPV